MTSDTETSDTIDILSAELIHEYIEGAYPDLEPRIIRDDGPAVVADAIGLLFYVDATGWSWRAKSGDNEESGAVDELDDVGHAVGVARRLNSHARP